MKLKLLSVALLALGFAVGSSMADTFRNPILPGFHPDPSICRAGDDYYLVTSSFEWYPGVPIFHSRDLVHWEQIGAVLSRPSNLDLDEVECSGGIFAPTLRYHDGTFYMITTMIGSPHHRGNFIVTAKNPAGPWSDPHWIEGAEGIDPSLFFDDDGKVYYCGNGRPEKMVSEKHRLIWVQQIDLNTWKLVGPKGTLDAAKYFASNSLGPVNNFEGPHLYKKDGAYYLMLSHGGTSHNHAVSIWRGASPLGPFSEENPGNPIVTHRADHPAGITCTGHADLFQAANGEWWMVLLGVRSDQGGTNMGRETFLVPADWSGVWPVINPHGRKGRVELEMPAPKLARFAAREMPARDDFDGSELAPGWTLIRTPRSTWWSLGSRAGWLTLAARPESLADKANPSFIGRRQEQSRCVASTRVDFAPEGAERAGIAILRSRDAVFELAVEAGGQGREVAAYANGKRLGAVAAPAGPVPLQIAVNGASLTFRCGRPDGSWTDVATADGSLLATAAGGRFTGTFVGMYATSNGQPSTSHAAFDWFALENQ